MNGAALAILSALSGLGVGLLIGAIWRRESYADGYGEGEIQGYGDGFNQGLFFRDACSRPAPLRSVEATDGVETNITYIWPEKQELKTGFYVKKGGDFSQENRLFPEGGTEA